MTSSRKYSTFDSDDEFDFSTWNSESIPLLKRTIDQAKSLGVKRSLSWVTSNNQATLPETENENRPWHWARKCKVFTFTLICITLTILLLFYPEPMSNKNIITVEKNLGMLPCPALSMSWLFSSRTVPKLLCLNSRVF